MKILLFNFVSKTTNLEIRITELVPSVDFIFLILAQVCFAAAILFKLNLFSMNAYVLAEYLFWDV